MGERRSLPHTSGLASSEEEIKRNKRSGDQEEQAIRRKTSKISELLIS
jgi:hypothetical protein